MLQFYIAILNKIISSTYNEGGIQARFYFAEYDINAGSRVNS